MKKGKILGAIIGIVLFVLLIAGVSYAWITWQSTNVDISGKSECFIINYISGNSLNREDVLLFDERLIINNNKINIKNGMALLDIVAGIDSNCTIEGNLNIDLNITELNDAFITGDSVGAFKYALASYDATMYSSVDGLINQSIDLIQNGRITSTGLVNLVSTPLTNTEMGYLLIFYIDGNLAFNDAQYSTFSATITGTAVQTEK